MWQTLAFVVVGPPDTRYHRSLVYMYFVSDGFIV